MSHYKELFIDYFDPILRFSVFSLSQNEFQEIPRECYAFHQLMLFHKLIVPRCEN